MSERAVAITGLGPVCAIGTGAETFWRELVEGRSGVRAFEGIAALRRGCRVAALVRDLPRPSLDGPAPLPRAVQLGTLAARIAWEAAAFEGERERVGVVVGTGLGNLDLIESARVRIEREEQLSPLTAFRSFAHAAACEIAAEHDLRGPIQTVSTGCNSGADALAVGLGWIRLGWADAVLVGGVEAELTPGFLHAMGAARALATAPATEPAAASRPFDRARDGNVPGEGAGFLVLESLAHARRRKARVHAELLGVASRAAGRRRAYDPFDPLLDPLPLARAMRAALADAGLAPRELSAISANGSSSVAYDPLEAAAIAEVFAEEQPEIPVHSIKGHLGQTGAVTPILQAIAAALSVEHGMLPLTLNCDSPDPRCPLQLVRDRSRSADLRAVLCNAIGFGGFYHSAFVVGRASRSGALHARSTAAERPARSASSSAPSSRSR